MRFRKVAVLRGPNIWANSPVIEAWVELGPLKDTASNAVPGFNDRLKSWLPTMVEHECSEATAAGSSPARRGTYLAHILEHVTLELQWLAGTPVGYGRARVTSEEGVYRVVVKYREEAVGRACLETARELILAALQDRPFDVAVEVQRLRDLAHEAAPGRAPRPDRGGQGARHPVPPARGRASSSSATGPASGGSPPPRPTGPGRSPRRSPRTRS